MAQTYVVTTDDGLELAARFSLEGDAIVVHSRGGAKGDDATNEDYTAGLRLILRRLHQAGVPIRGAWVDSTTVQAMPLAQRSILAEGEANQAVEHILSLLAARMKGVRSDPSSGAKGGNSTKRIRIQTGFTGSKAGFAEVLRGKTTEGETKSSNELTPGTLGVPPASLGHPGAPSRSLMPQLILQPAVGPPAPRNLGKSIAKPVGIASLPLSDPERSALRVAVGADAAWAWGGRGREPWESMLPGDVVLFLSGTGGSIGYKGVVVATLDSEAVAEAIWGTDSKEFRYVYFLSRVETCAYTRQQINVLIQNTLRPPRTTG